MGFDAKKFLVGWFLMVIIGVLLWYRNNGFDRIYAVYAILVGAILLLLYGVYSGMNPQTAGKLAYSTIWAFLIVLTSMVYVTTGKISAGIASLFMILIAVFAIYFTLRGKYKIDINGRFGDPPYWISTEIESYMILFIGLGLILPLTLLLSYESWSDPILYIAILFIIISGSILATWYKSTQAISVWFYSLIILILFFWIVGMF